MAIEQSLWRMGNKPKKLNKVPLGNESELEELVFQDIAILNTGWLLIGRQVLTDHGKYIDLLALDADGSVIIIELKRDKTPRDVVAQALDYASWVVKLPPEKLATIYRECVLRYELQQDSLDQAFQTRFGTPLTDVSLNSSHQMVVVASELDEGTERIINYLNDYANVPINAVFFTAFSDGDNQYLSRAWMIDPVETQERALSQGAREPWNGEFYVSFGHHDQRHWQDAMTYGFVSGGGGAWYSKTLDMLKEGDRVWVNIPKTGYVGVGWVTGAKCRLEEYQFKTEQQAGTLSELPTKGAYSNLCERSEEEAEYMVPIHWEHTVGLSGAFSETGLFGNQHTVCQPRADKWRHTVKRLRQVWSIDED